MKKSNHSLTPIHDFVTEYSKSSLARFHMPGHKGNFNIRSQRSVHYTHYDITEIDGADSLYHADGIIKESEANAKEYFGSYATVFSASGSTLCIQTMLLTCLKRGDTIICGRNAHISFHNALALFDFIPHWVIPECIDDLGVSGIVTAEQIETAIKETISNSAPAKAVYITTPDYMGVLSDVKAIADVCKKYDIPLLVDNAHGGHLKAMEQNLHPISLGATLCCDGAHKTLPSLTGAAYLHSSRKYTEQDLKETMSLIGTTSPSYLILSSLEQCTHYLINHCSNDFKLLAQTKKELVDTAKAVGFKIVETEDPTKLTLDTYSVGYTAEDAAETFRARRVECEYAKGAHIVFILSPFNTPTDFKKLKEAISSFIPRAPLSFIPFSEISLKQIMTPNEAYTSEHETILLDDSLGRISATPSISCPPGVPVVTYGEEINSEMILRLKNSGKTHIKVVK